VRDRVRSTRRVTVHYLPNQAYSLRARLRCVRRANGGEPHLQMLTFVVCLMNAATCARASAELAKA